MKKNIESSLAHYFNRRYCCLTNRGTTALTAAITTLQKPPGSLAVFPAAMCAIPVFSARFAGWEPAFADVNLKNGNFDLNDLDKVLNDNKGRVGAVVPVHMFGQPEDMNALQDLCAQYRVPVIEDVALSMGAVYQGKKIGGFGEVSCLSFVRKMLPLEMGGAVLTDDASIDHKVRCFVNQLPDVCIHPEEVSSTMKEFHGLTGCVAAQNWAHAHVLHPFQDIFQRLFLTATNDKDWQDSVVLSELADLEDVVKARQVRAEVYDTVFHHPRIKPMAQGGSSFFAYPVQLPGVSVESFLHFAAEKGAVFKRVAYPAIPMVFGSHRTFPQAHLIEKEVMGFPVDDNQPVSDFWSYAQDFQSLFEDYLKVEHHHQSFDWRGKLSQRLRC